MVPQEVLVVPMFQLMQWFGWVDTPQALILPFAFTFISFWNGYLWPLIIVNDYDYLGTLPIGPATFSGQFGTRWDLQTAASIISMVPTAILVIVLQKHLVRGIATAGIAGR